MKKELQEKRFPFFFQLKRKNSKYLLLSRQDSGRKNVIILNIALKLSPSCHEISLQPTLLNHFFFFLKKKGL